MNVILKNVFVISLLTFSLQINAAENCAGIINQILRNFDPEIAKVVKLDQHIGHRNFVANFAKKNDIPVFMKRNSMGEEIPVILINTKSAKKMSNYIDNSYGTEVSLQPGYGNDHGLMRTGNYIIDLDAPGYRGYGEIEKTGLAWKNFNAYTARRTAASGVTLEVSYLLTPEEKRIIDFYQRIRRAAIFRVKFSFKDFKTEDHPFLLNSGGEHCFIFCKGNAVTSHIYELEKSLSAVGLKTPDAYFAKPEVTAAINKIKDIILNTHPDQLSPDLIKDGQVISLFNGLYPKEVVSLEQKSEFIRLAISYDGSKSYNKTLKELGVTSDYGVGDAVNPRVSAILVYDEAADPKLFNNAQYSAHGAFTPWPAGVQKPVE